MILHLLKLIKLPLLGVYFVIWLIFWILHSMLFIKNDDKKHYSTESKSVFDALYYNTVVFGTVGFGDITPTSKLAKILTICQILINVLATGLLML